MTEEELNKAGWFQWYSKEYYVNMKIFASGVDYKKRGLSREEAIKFEKDVDYREEVLKSFQVGEHLIKLLSEMWSKK